MPLDTPKHPLTTPKCTPNPIESAYVEPKVDECECKRLPVTTSSNSFERSFVKISSGMFPMTWRATSGSPYLEALLKHYTTDAEVASTLLSRVERGWTDVTLTLGHGFYCRLQRFSEFDTLTLSGPGHPAGAYTRPLVRLTLSTLCEIRWVFAGLQ